MLKDEIEVKMSGSEARSVRTVLSEAHKLAAFVAERREAILANADTETTKKFDELLDSLRIRNQVQDVRQRLEGQLGMLELAQCSPPGRKGGPRPQ
jgi:hypothetical protein